MQAHLITTYSFNELSDAAKKVALDKHRDNSVDGGSNWFEGVYDNWKEKLEAAGFEEPKISFSGFWSQGDGACFDATINTAIAAKALGYNELELKYLDISNTRYSIATNSHANHYSHENTRYVEGNSEDLHADDLKVLNADIKELASLIYEDLESTAKDLIELRLKNPGMTCRLLKDESLLLTDLEAQRKEMSVKIYRDLEKESNYLTSDECVEQNIEANEYEFNADGTPY